MRFATLEVNGRQFVAAVSADGTQYCEAGRLFQEGFAVADIEENTVQFYNLTPFTNAITKAETRPLFFLDGTIAEEPTDA